MELRTFWRSLVRRWYLTIPVVLLAAAATAFAVVETGPTYKSQASVLLFPPASTVKAGQTDETQGNPYLMLAGLTQARDVVIRSMTSRAADEEFAKHAPGASYKALTDFTTSGPIILLIVEAPTRQESVDGLAYLVDQVPPTLIDLQSSLKVDRTDYITSMPITQDKTATPVYKSQIRLGIVTAAGVLGIGLLLVGFVDGVLLARAPSRRHAGAAMEDGEDDGEDDTEADREGDGEAGTGPGARVSRFRSQKGVPRIRDTPPSGIG